MYMEWDGWIWRMNQNENNKTKNSLLINKKTINKRDLFQFESMYVV